MGEPTAEKKPKPEQGMMVIGKQNEMLMPLQSKEAMAIINSYLLDSQGKPRNPDITYERLLLDMAGSISINPDLQSCSSGSFFNCMAFAARHGMTFGDGGVWLIPRDKNQSGKFQNATPQLSARGMVSRTKECGVDRIEVILVLEGDKLEVKHDDAGQIVKILHEFDYMGDRNYSKLKAAFGVAIFTDGSKRISYYSGADIMGRRDYSAAQNSLMWQKAPWKAYERSVKASVSKEIVGDFTRGASQMGALALPSGDEGSIDAEFEPIEETAGEIPFKSPTADATAELESRSEPEPEPERPPAPETPPGELPTFPALPETMMSLKDGSRSLQEAVDMLQVAWAELPVNAHGLKELWDSRSQDWGRHVQTNEAHALSGLKAIVWKAAENAGFPQG